MNQRQSVLVVVFSWRNKGTGYFNDTPTLSQNPCHIELLKNSDILRTQDDNKTGE